MQDGIGGFVKTLEEFETHLNKHGWTTSREELRSKDKPLLKQTVTARQGEFLARAVYTRRKVKDDADQIDLNYTGAYMADGDERPRWSIFKSLDALMQFVHEYDITLLAYPGPPPAPLRKSNKCWCRKVRYMSEETASKVLRKIRRERERMGVTRRLEERVYPCPYNSAVFHLTSQKDWTEQIPEGREEGDEHSTGDPASRGAGELRPADTSDGLGDRPGRGKGRDQSQIPQVRHRSARRLPAQDIDDQEGDA